MSTKKARNVRIKIVQGDMGYTAEIRDQQRHKLWTTPPGQYGSDGAMLSEAQAVCEKHGWNAIDVDAPETQQAPELAQAVGA